MHVLALFRGQIKCGGRECRFYLAVCKQIIQVRRLPRSCS